MIFVRQRPQHGLRRRQRVLSRGREVLPAQLEEDALLAGSIEAGSHASGPELLKRSLGAAILGADQKDHALDVPESMSEHEPLEFAVGSSTPMRSSEKVDTFDGQRGLALAIESVGHANPSGRSDRRQRKRWSQGTVLTVFSLAFSRVLSQGGR